MHHAQFYNISNRHSCWKNQWLERIKKASNRGLIKHQSSLLIALNPSFVLSMMQFVLIVIHDHLNIKLYNQIRHHVLMQGQSYELYEDYAELWKDHE